MITTMFGRKQARGRQGMFKLSQRGVILFGTMAFSLSFIGFILWGIL